jgi:hypothetical protein
MLLPFSTVRPAGSALVFSPLSGLFWGVGGRERLNTLKGMRNKSPNFRFRSGPWVEVEGSSPKE